MSFQDVGTNRRRQHPIFDRHRSNHDEMKSSMNKTSKKVSTSHRSSHEKEYDNRRKEHGRHSKSSRGDAPLARRPSTARRSASTSALPERSSPRAPRPRLSLTCPVTARNLVDDPSVMTSPEDPEVTSDEEVEDVLSVAPVQRKALSKRQSKFANLTNELVQFQKLVTQLERLVEQAASSPEAQWRTRITMRSAEEADQALSNGLYEFQAASHYDPQEDPSDEVKVKGASRKLQRDYKRIHQIFVRAAETYHKNQQADLSFLTSKPDADESKEDFFDRAMREREAEVKQINQSMHKVNEIYKDLAKLVDGQQDQVDRVGDATEDSKAQTRSGLEQIQQGILAMCGPLVGQEASIDDDIRAGPKHGAAPSMNVLQLLDELHEQLLESGCSPQTLCQEDSTSLRHQRSYSTYDSSRLRSYSSSEY